IVLLLGASQPQPQQQGDCRPCAKAVVLHSRSTKNGEEAEDYCGPYEQQQACLQVHSHASTPGSRRWQLAQGKSQEHAPGKKPCQVGQPPQPQRDGIVVWRPSRA